MSSIEWSDAQTRFLIDERKQRNAEFHLTPNKKKRLFWDDIANKINEWENTNYFTGEDCNRKFTNLKKAFKTAQKYKEGTGTKRSLVGEEIYEEFSNEFWLKPELPFDQAHNEGIRRLSRTSELSSSQGTSTNSSSIHTSKASTDSVYDDNDTLFCEQQSSSSSERPNRTPNESPKKPSTIETPPISRPVTPTIPSFSQNANVINVTINYGERSSEQQE